METVELLLGGILVAIIAGFGLLAWLLDAHMTDQARRTAALQAQLRGLVGENFDGPLHEVLGPLNRLVRDASRVGR